MISREMEIKIPSGLDPSTIALFIQIASQYDSSVYVEVKNKKVNAKSIMGMITPHRQHVCVVIRRPNASPLKVVSVTTESSSTQYDGMQYR